MLHSGRDDNQHHQGVASSWGKEWEVLDDANQQQADEDQNDGEHINITIIQC